MKAAIRSLLASLAVLFLLTACAEKPDAELASAEKAIAGVLADGAEQYAPSELQSIKRKYDEATTEITYQNTRTLSNYSLAKFTLSQVVEDCDALKPKLAERKAAAEEAAKVAALQVPAAEATPAPQAEGAAKQ